jgi:hypothetical protein
MRFELIVDHYNLIKSAFYREGPTYSNDRNGYWRKPLAVITLESIWHKTMPFVQGDAHPMTDQCDYMKNWTVDQT